MLLSERCCRRVMTTLVRPSTVCLPLNDRNLECVCKEGRINFFHSVLYNSVLYLSYLKIHCNLPFSEMEDLDFFFPHHYLNLNPHLSYICGVFALTFVRAVCHFLTFSVCVCPSSLLSVTAGLSDHVYDVCLFHSMAQAGIATDLGMLWKCHCLVVLYFMTQFIQHWWFLSPSVAFCFVCLESGTVNKW